MHSFKGGDFKVNFVLVFLPLPHLSWSNYLGVLVDDPGYFPLDDEAYPHHLTSRP